MPYDKCPVLGSNPPETVPYDMVKAHEKQAWANHGQSLDRLIERGGLSWKELLAVLTDERWDNVHENEETAKTVVKLYAEQFEKTNGVPNAKCFIVPVTWQMSGYVVSIAENAYDAWKDVKDHPENYDLPEEKNYVEDSFEVSYDDEETVEIMSDLYEKGELKI